MMNAAMAGLSPFEVPSGPNASTLATRSIATRAVDLVVLRTVLLGLAEGRGDAGAVPKTPVPATPVLTVAALDGLALGVPWPLCEMSTRTTATAAASQATATMEAMRRPRRANRS